MKQVSQEAFMLFVNSHLKRGVQTEVCPDTDVKKYVVVEEGVVLASVSDGKYFIKESEDVAAKIKD